MLIGRRPVTRGDKAGEGQRTARAAPARGASERGRQPGQEWVVGGGPGQGISFWAEGSRQGRGRGWGVGARGRREGTLQAVVSMLASASRTPGSDLTAGVRPGGRWPELHAEEGAWPGGAGGRRSHRPGPALPPQAEEL